MEAYRRSHQTYITKLCGTAHVPLADSFWLELVRCPTPLSALSPLSFQAFLRPFCEQFVKNNPKTDVLNAANALVLLRGVTVHLISLVPPSQQESTLLPSQFPAKADDVVARLAQTCFVYLERTELASKTYVLLHTIITFLIACCSSPLYHAEAGSAGQGLVASITQGQNAHAGQVIFVLLNHVVQRARMDSTVRLDVSTIADMTSSSTVLATAKRLASDIFMAPAKAFTGLLQSQSSFLLAPVADASLSLLLLLLYEDDMGAQHRASSLQSSFAVWCQRYKLSGHFLDLLNLDNNAVEDAEAGIAALMSSLPSVSFSKLFERIVGSLQQPQSALLLYTLLTRCRLFRCSVLVRSDIDTLIVPLLEQLYSGSSAPVKHLYILLIIVLLLSEDDGFAKTVFKVRLQRVPWFTERSHFGLSLGDLMVSVLLKSSFRNTSVAQDEYLHSNALSALINLVPHATHISSNTAQRLCFIIEGAHKRLIWLDHKIVESVDRKVHMTERQLLQDFLRNVLNALDILCYRTLTKNAELVYSLLHQQAVLKKLSADAMWEAALQNALTVVFHFNECVDIAQKAAGGTGEWGVSQVMRVIQHELLSWKRTALKPVAETHCTYEEAPQAREFFLPYLWSSILDSSCQNILPSPQIHAFLKHRNS